MRFLVLGATGFIGSHICVALLAAGHEVIGAGRRIEALARAFPGMPTSRIDLASATEHEMRQALAGVDVLVNVAGQLNRSLDAVHVEGPRRLYRAARDAGVARIVLVSAISARPDVANSYATTKLAGEEVLRQAGVPWTILRPSMVVGSGSFGGSSVLRGLAGLPFVTPVLPMSGAGVSPIHARDLGEVVRIVAENERFADTVLEPAGAETLTVGEMVAAYRQWLGFPPGFGVPVPRSLLTTAGAIGEWFGGPMSTTALQQLEAGNAGNPVTFAAQLGWVPRGLTTILRDEPAEVQDRWHARLFFLALAVRFSLVLLWIGSALAGFFNGTPMALQFAAALGLPDALVPPLVAATCLLDLAIAALLLTRRSRLAAAVQLIVVLGYTLGLTLALPGLWADPFGALLKNIPILALIAVNAILSEAR
jgi:uncharacterized protein YbjT (DUF2867 family)